MELENKVEKETRDLKLVNTIRIPFETNIVLNPLYSHLDDLMANLSVTKAPMFFSQREHALLLS